MPDLILGLSPSWTSEQFLKKDSTFSFSTGSLKICSQSHSSGCQLGSSVLYVMSAWAKMSEVASSLTYLVASVGMTGKARDGQASLSLSLSGLFLLQGNQTFHMVPSIFYSEQSKSLGKKNSRILTTSRGKSQNIISITFYWSRKSLRLAQLKRKGN